MPAKNMLGRKAGQEQPGRMLPSAGGDFSQSCYAKIDPLCGRRATVRLLEDRVIIDRNGQPFDKA